MANKQADLEKQNKQSWLRRLFARLRTQNAGDTITAQIGEDVQNVVVGKNIIQIGAIEIPLSLAILIAMTTVAIVAIVLINAYWTRIQKQQTQDILAIVNAPTPTPTPVRMGAGQFNIAVTEFNALDMTGKPITSDQEHELSMSVANFIRDQKDTIETIISQKVDVLGPDVLTITVEVTRATVYAQELNADVLVYGNLRKTSSDQWQLEPKFYLSDEAVKQAEELGGEHALGTNINYRMNSTASTSDVNTTLKTRLKAFVQILRGLSYISFGNLDGYQKAAETFKQAAEDPDWGATNNSTGQEILYLFLGNAYLEEAQLTDDTKPERKELLTESKAAFLKAVDLNAAYARSYNGLGLVNFQLARPSSQQDECDWDWQLIDEAGVAYSKALDAPAAEKPPSGQVDYRAHFGLGRVHFWRGYCVDGAKQEWDNAEQDYQFVINEFNKMTNPIPHLIDGAGFVYLDLGSMALVRSENLAQSNNAAEQAEAQALLSTSIQAYQKVFELFARSKTEDSKHQGIAAMPYYLTALCIAGKHTDATIILDRFVSTLINGDSVRSQIIQRLDTSLWEECTNAKKH